MRKLLLLLIPLFLCGNEHRLLLSGFALHETKNNRFDERYNSVNYGAGYEYNYYEKAKSPYFGMNILLLEDSYYNPQLTFGLGHYIRFGSGPLQSAIGLSGFIGIKKIYGDDDTDRSGGSYGLAGGIAPALNIYYKNASVNFMYVPSFHYKEVDVTGFLFTYFSWRF